MIVILYFVFLLFSIFIYFDKLYTIFNCRNSIDLVFRVFSNFFEHAPYFVKQSATCYLFSIQLILVISFLLIIFLNNAFSVCKRLSFLGLIESRESHNNKTQSHNKTFYS